MHSPLAGFTLVYGGSFNPPHMGHQLACLYGLEALGAESLWVVPVHTHPFGKELVHFDHRVALCRLMVEPLGSRVLVNTIESELPGSVRTFELFSELAKREPQRKFAMLMGSDLVGERESWYRFSELQKLIKIVVVGRAGVQQEAAVNSYPIDLPDISSSQVREKLGSGQATTGFLPISVEQYIQAHGLYRGSQT